MAGKITFLVKGAFSALTTRFSLGSGGKAAAGTKGKSSDMPFDRG